MTAYVTRSRAAPWYAPQQTTGKDLFVTLFEPLLACQDWTFRGRVLVAGERDPRSPRDEA